MNYSNAIIIISTILLAAIFLGSVFVNLGIKSSREELYGIQEKIKDFLKKLYNCWTCDKKFLTGFEVSWICRY